MALGRCDDVGADCVVGLDFAVLGSRDIVETYLRGMETMVLFGLVAVVVVVGNRCVAG